MQNIAVDVYLLIDMFALEVDERSKLGSLLLGSRFKLADSVLARGEWIFAATAAAAVLVLLTLRFQAGQNCQGRFKRIPGPRQLPIIGNIGQVDAARQHPKFLEWARRYGEIYQVRFGSNRIVVLNSAKASIELLDRRSSIYSCRQGPHFAHDLMSAGQRQVFLPYSKEWKAARASVHPFLMGTKSQGYKTIQEHESAVLIHDLLRHTQHCLSHPRDQDLPLTHETGWEAHVRRYTTSVVMNITYGRRVTSTYRNPELHKIYDVLGNLAVVGQPGRNACDAFAFVRKLPDWLAPWRVQAKAMHKWEMELWGGLLERTKRDRQHGRPCQGYVASVLDRRQHAPSSASFDGSGLTAEGEMTDLLLAYTAATVLEAGSDTTASSISFFILACLNNPRIWDKLFKELISACGDALPTFDKIQDIRYLRACIKETLRRRPPTIMGIPHRVIRDDVYDGYLIRAGTVVMGNVWAIHNDPQRYPNPEKFEPERFLGDDLSAAQSAATMDAERRDHYTFGWGRRVCQGMHIAENSLMIVLARLVWCFELSTPVSSDGTTPIAVPSIDQEANFLPGFVSQPKAFACHFVPRSDHVVQTLENAAAEAQEYWSANDLEPDQRDHYYKD